MLILSGQHTQFKRTQFVEKVQMGENKLIKEIKYLSYTDSLKYLHLPTLLHQRLRGDMIMMYKFLSGIYDCNTACQLFKPTHFVTRGYHLLWLFKKHVHYELLNIILAIVSNWNSLPDNVINVTQLVYLKIDRIIFLVIKHVLMNIKPTWLVLAVEVNWKCAKLFSVFVVVCH